jgi:hypothetical protein
VPAPTATLPKLNVEGKRLTMVALPESDTICGLGRALSLTLRVPVRLPIAVGVKLTLIVHVDPPARLPPQLLVSAKSPLVVMLVMLSDAVPVLLNVTGFNALVVPSTWERKFRLVGDTLAFCAATAEDSARTIIPSDDHDVIATLFAS